MSIIDWRRDYDSVDSMLSHIQSEDTPKWEYTHESREVGNSKFYGSESFEEAAQLLEHGWQEGRAKMSEALDADVRGYELIPELDHGVAGFTPDVPAYLAGSPASMWTYSDVNATKNIYRIYIGVSASHVVKPEQMFNYGAAVVRVIDRLEAQGNRVELTAMSVAKDTDKSIAVFSTRIKEAHDPLNLDQLAFVFAHASYLRRMIFAATETLVEKNGEDKFSSSYGRAGQIDESMIEDYDSNCLVIGGIGTNVGKCKTPDTAEAWMIEDVNKQAGETVIEVEG